MQRTITGVEGSCPDCGKRYQARNVNAADYRVDYWAPAGQGHMCARCWRTGEPASYVPLLVWDADELGPGLPLVHVAAVPTVLSRPERVLCGASPRGGQWTEADGPEVPSCRACRESAEALTWGRLS